MASLSHTFTDVAAPGESSDGFRSKRDQEVTITLTGTIDADCAVVLEKNDGKGAAWRPIAKWTPGAHTVSYARTGDGTTWRFRAEVGVIEGSALVSLAVGLVDVVRDLEVWRDNDGGIVAKVTDAGLETKSVSSTALASDTISEKTSGAGVTVDGVLLKDDQVRVDVINEKTSSTGVTVDGVLIKDNGIRMTGGAIQFPRGTAATAILQGFGAVASEGMQLACADEVISLVDNVALYKTLAYQLPAGSVILCAQANIESAITGSGTSTKVGLGVEADPDLYGKTSGLTKNLKITTTPDWAVLAGATPIRVSAVANDGSAGDTAQTVGSVRVRLIFLTPVALADAP